MKLANFTREHADVLAGGPAIAASSAVSTHASGTASVHVASAVTIADAGNYYTSGTVEGALQEIGTVHRIYDEASLVGTATSGFNFVGANVSGTVSGGTAVITISGSSSSLVVYDEGVLVGTPTAMDFIGSGVSAALSSGTAQITVTSGSAYSNIPIYDEGSLMGTATTGLNFTGAGVSGTVTSGTAVITISGGDWWDATTILESDETVTNSSTLTNSSLTFPFGASDTVIQYEAMLLYQATANGDIKVDLDSGGTPTFHGVYRYTGSDDTSNAALSGVTRDSAVTSTTDRTAGGTSTSGLTRVLWMQGFIMDATAAITVTLRFAQNSAQPGESAVLKAGSFLRYRVLG